ncbi:MAG: dockerin type I domain-containing protein [Tepidisphaerales bacterium]
MANELTSWKRNMRRLAAAVLGCILAVRSSAQDVSPPVYLQWFEGSYGTIENRMSDVFKAGYGAIYTPPPGRADSSNSSVGYDQYDRFDLGKPGPGNGTLYGTETGLRTTVNMTHRAGLDYYVDMVWNHSGFSDLSTPGFYDAGGYPGLNITLPYAIDGDYHSKYATGDLNGRLAGLVDIDHSTNFQMIRSPVPGYADNIRAGTIPAFGRLANVPDINNLRFYPDRSLQPIMVYDPTTGEQNIAIYPFNNANPMAGTPVEENALGYLMRNTQWLVQSIGIDGFRIDAAKNFDQWVLNYYDRAVYRSSFRTLLDGTQKQIFAFSEVYDSNPAYLQSFVRKDINPATPGVIGGNRDVLDFPLFFALRDNLTGNGYQNNWYNIRTASIDMQDDGLLDGSQGVKFVSSHDDTGAYLSNVAYAYTLMTPGNAIVYFNGHEFGTNRSFPQDGRGDALGGLYGNAITGLVDLRNRYGRGNFAERWVDQNLYAFERQGSCVVLLNNRTDGGYDSRTIQTSFAPGTPLIELTGNAGDPTSDPYNNIPKLVVVNNDSTINVRFLRNTAPGTSNFTGNGYLVYGLATPQGAMSFAGVSKVIPGDTPTSATNGTTRLSNLYVVTGDSMQVKLDTVPVNLLGFYRDRPADGDNALIKLDDGVDVNKNGYIDYTTPGTVQYGFENFTTVHSPGWFAADGNGHYAQTIDTTGLAEGEHFITVRAFRHRDDGGPAVFTDWRETIYIDRLPPNSTVQSVTQPAGQDGSTRDVIARSIDQTANDVHIFVDLPAGMGDAAVKALVGDGNKMGYWDRDQYTYRVNGLTNGNHVFTIVSYELTGNVNVQRFAEQAIANSPYGAGLGDLNFNGTYDPADISAFASVLYSNDAQFNPAADLNGDGRVTEADLMLLGPRLNTVSASGATMASYHNLLINNPPDRPRILTTLLNNSAGSALTKSATGDFTIAGPQQHGPGASLTLNGGNTFMNTDAGDATSANLAITINAGASITFGSSQHLNSLTINNALATVAAGHDKTVITGGLAINGDTARLDLKDNDMVVKYAGASPYAQIRQWINDGAGGAHGIISTATPLPFATTFAPVDNNEIHTLTWNGLTIYDCTDLKQVILIYTYAGDVNLDGQVTEADLVNIIANMGHRGSWLDGDVTGDGWVTQADYDLVKSEIGAGTGGPLFGKALPSLADHTSTVPEPGATVAVVLVGLLLTRRPLNRVRGS